VPPNFQPDFLNFQSYSINNFAFFPKLFGGPKI